MQRKIEQNFQPVDWLLKSGTLPAELRAACDPPCAACGCSEDAADDDSDNRFCSETNNKIIYTNKSYLKSTCDHTDARKPLLKPSWYSLSLCCTSCVPTSAAIRSAASILPSCRRKAPYSCRQRSKCGSSSSVFKK